jgi:hypothetical protein
VSIVFVRRHVIGPFDIVNPRGIGGCEAIERAREIASHIGIGIFLDDQRSRSVPHEHEQGTVLRPALRNEPRCFVCDLGERPSAAVDHERRSRDDLGRESDDRR